MTKRRPSRPGYSSLPPCVCLLPGALQLPFPRSRDKQGGGKQLSPGNISQANLITRNEWQKKDEPQRPEAQPVAAEARTEAPWPGAAPRVCLSHLPGSYRRAADEGDKKTGPLSFLSAKRPWVLSSLLSSVGCGGDARRLWNRLLSLVSALPPGQGTLHVLPLPCTSVSSSVIENTDNSAGLNGELSRGNELIQGKLLGQHLADL